MGSRLRTGSEAGCDLMSGRNKIGSRASAKARVGASRSKGRAKTDLSSKPPDRGLIVGIGASAGGLSGLQIVPVEHPTDSGMAFILVQHLSPDHKSMLTDLLACRKK